ncbi:MAG: nif-specific transcriptional activator NifA, partial [Zoogloeaceae bacterium]|nr:nif-specific transcriptional activator NifA [Zoogloeaceae bacterium]
PEDIPEISRHLLAKIGNAQKRKLTLSEAALRSLAHYEWPGNVRELENCLERAAVLSENGVIDTALIRFPQRERSASSRNTGSTATTRPPTRPPVASEPPAAPLPENTSTDCETAPGQDVAQESEDERQRIIEALERAGWVQAKAARLLDMTPRQISYRIRILNIELKQL